jgi:hypothetical protein
MSVTKSTSSDLANSMTAGTYTSGSPFTSTEVDISAAHGATFDVSITNGATGPTVGASVQLQVSHDGGTTWVDRGYPLLAGTASSAVYRWTFYADSAEAGDVRVAAYGNTGQTVTLDMYWTIATAIA